MRIYISPSNQTDNIYNDGKTSEADACYLIGQKVADFLSKAHDTKLASKTSTLTTRCKESDTYKADYHLCIHTNAGGGQGTELYCWPTNYNDKYIKAVYNNVSTLTPTRDRGIKDGSKLLECKTPKAKTCYVECEFHDTHGDWILNNITQIAWAIASAFLTPSEKVDAMKEIPATTNKNIWRVQCGAFTSKERAEQYAAELKAKKIDCFVTQ